MSSATQAARHPPTLFGYDVISHIGDGAGAKIYAVSDPKTQQVFALKHVQRKDDKDQRFIDQLHTELDVSKKVNHPNVRRAFEIRTTRTMFVFVSEVGLVMELLDAMPLDRYLERHGKVPVPRLLHLLVQAARGMAAINSAGYVHGDMKPANIMIPADEAKGPVKVIDLGQAGQNGKAKARVQGSPYFIAPEQIKLQPVTFRTDVFNFGATLYWALTGRHVSTEYTRKKGLSKGKSDNAAEPLPYLGELPEKMAEDLSDLTMECVRSRPDERPETMSAVANRLGLILRGSDRNAAVA